MNVRIPLRETCSLSRFSYALSRTKERRQASLRKAVGAYGSKYVIHKLTVLRTYRKARDTPSKRQQYTVLNKDIAYVQCYRDAMSDSARARDLRRSREYEKLSPANKMYCSKTTKKKTSATR
jgi:hypothetical protein